MTIDPKNENHLIASEGKVLARVSNLKEKYTEIWLGYHTNWKGEKKMDTKNDFVEISMKTNNE